jgi:peroxiredoxin Q/BCP
MGIFNSSSESELEVGMVAPRFELLDQSEKSHNLSDYLGKWVVIYFYPKDDTPGCTKEACSFSNDIAVLHSLEVQVLGVSVDSTKSHADFVNKFSLQFPLLSDLGGKTASDYDSLTKIGPLKLAKRHTFIINPEGKIAKIYRTVKPAIHSDEVIAEIKALQN